MTFLMKMKNIYKLGIPKKFGIPNLYTFVRSVKLKSRRANFYKIDMACDRPKFADIVHKQSFFPTTKKY